MRPSGSTDSKISGSKLLNLKWDAIGLQRAQQLGTVNRKQRHSLMYIPEDRNAQSATGWLANTNSSPKLAEIVTEEGMSRRDLINPHSRT